MERRARGACFQNPLQNRPDIHGDARLPFRGRVDPVGLIQVVNPAHPFKQKGNQRRIVLRRNAGENGPELLNEFAAHVLRHLHPSDDHRDSRGFGACAPDDPGKIFRRLVGRDAAQAVIAAECDNQHLRTGAERPIDASQPAGGGVAADPRIDDRKGQPGGIDFLLEQGRVSLRWVKAVTRGDAVAENDDPAPWGSASVCVRSI